jgi:soluble lytic murein transglycosylase-like protein
MVREISITLLADPAAADFQGYAATPFDPLFARYGAKRSIPVPLLQALARHESHLDPSAKGELNRNRSRDWGLMQVNDSQAVIMGKDPARLLEPEYNIDVATELLDRIRTELRERFSTLTWIAAYNAGSPVIRNAGIFNVAYVSSVLYHLVSYELAAQLKPPEA